jgi:hypothetical protein
MISIASLISQSPAHADFVFDSLRQHTPMMWAEGQIDFFFVAVDPTTEVLKHLQNRKYRYETIRNTDVSEKSLFKKGISWPIELHRMYRAWNHALRKAKGEIVVLVENDHAFSPQWLENLLEYAGEQMVVSPRVLERSNPFPSRINGTGAEMRDFGKAPYEFRRDDFLAFAETFSRDCTTQGGCFFPCVIHKSMAKRVGYFPEGNIAGDDFYHVADYGDRKFFRKLQAEGVQHITVHNSIVYHMQCEEHDFKAA